MDDLELKSVELRGGGQDVNNFTNLKKLIKTKFRDSDISPLRD